MRVWPWFAASALWLGLAVAFTFRGFGFVVNTGKHLTTQAVLDLAVTVLYLILLGWIIPLCVGLWRLTLRFRRRL